VGDQLVQPGDVAQQRHAGGVQVDADRIDARFNDTLKRLLEVLGADVVLVEADADVLRVDLDQLAEGSCRRRPMEIVPRRVASKAGTPRADGAGE